MSIGDGLALNYCVAHDCSAGLWVNMTGGDESIMQYGLVVGGGGPAGKRGSFCPLAEVLRLCANVCSQVQDCDRLLALLPIQIPHAQGCHVAIFTIDPPDGSRDEEGLGISCRLYGQVFPDVWVQIR